MTRHALRYALILLFCVPLLSNCGGGGGGTADSAGPNTGAPQANKVQLSWTLPDSRENGLFLALSEISGVEILYKTTSSSNYTSVTLLDGPISTYTMENLGTGTYEFKLAIIDSAGIHSRYSSTQRVSVNL